MATNDDSNANALISAYMDGKSAAIEEIVRKQYKQYKNFELKNKAVALDLLMATGAAASGNYEEAGRITASAIGSGAGVALAEVQSVYSGAAYPIVRPIAVAAGSYFGGIAGEYVYDYGIPPLKWTGNAIEGGFHTGTKDYLSPYLQGLTTELSYDILEPRLKVFSNDLESLTKSFSNTMEKSSSSVSPYLERSAQGIGGFVAPYLQQFGDWVSGRKNDYGVSYQDNPYQISPGMQALIDSDFLWTDPYLYLPSSYYEPTIPYLGYVPYSSSISTVSPTATKTSTRIKTSAANLQIIPASSSARAGGYDYPE